MEIELKDVPKLSIGSITHKLRMNFAEIFCTMDRIRNLKVALVLLLAAERSEESANSQKKF